MAARMMRSRRRHLPRLPAALSLCAFAVALTAADVQGGWLWDCLTGRNQSPQYYSAYAIDPCAAPYAGLGGVAAAPGYYQPAGPSGGSWGCFGGGLSRWQQPYATTWQQVPVTYYRSVNTVAPMTGTPVAAVNPCETYTWQMQRSPRWWERCWLTSWISRLSCRQSTPYAPYSYNNAAYPSYGLPSYGLSWNECCASPTTTSSIVPSTSAAPQYYTPPGSATHLTPSPIPSSTPADIRPSLPPTPLPTQPLDRRSETEPDRAAPVIVPVHDPARPTSEGTPLPPPALLGPGNNTARRDRQMVVAPIAWAAPVNGPSAESVAAPEVAKRVSPLVPVLQSGAAHSRLWDATGWQPE